MCHRNGRERIDGELQFRTERIGQNDVKWQSKKLAQPVRVSPLSGPQKTMEICCLDFPLEKFWVRWQGTKNDHFGY
jgi:hypothetical protein